MAQSPHQKHRRPACAHDVPVGAMRRSLWRICDSSEVQYPNPDPATVFLRPVFDYLGSVFEVWAVSNIVPLIFCAFRFGKGELDSWHVVFENRRWRVWTAALITAAFGLLFAGLETLLVFVIRGPYNSGIEWPVTLVGVVAAVLLISGFLPVPFEIAKRRGHVIGIDFGFLTIDCLGAVFSLTAIGMLGLFWFWRCSGFMVDTVCSGAAYLWRSCWSDVRCLVRKPSYST